MRVTYSSKASRALIFIDPRVDGEAARWAVAHELGHLSSPTAADEDDADEFAGHFLAPHSELRALVQNGADGDTLHERFLVPAAAFAAHARRGNLITAVQYRHLRTWPAPFSGDALPRPSGLAAAVHQRTIAGETLPQIAEAAFLSNDELKRGNLPD